MDPSFDLVRKFSLGNHTPEAPLSSATHTFGADLDGAGFLVYPDLVVFARDPNHGDVRDKILRQ